MSSHKRYTCNEYREEMILLTLRQRLNKKGLAESEKETIRKEISRLESVMQMK
ncbi:MAG: hypothetical protein ACKVE4_09440 [Dissulfuribacterales bacterium]